MIKSFVGNRVSPDRPQASLTNSHRAVRGESLRRSWVSNAFESSRPSINPYLAMLVVLVLWGLAGLPDDPLDPVEQSIEPTGAMRSAGKSGSAVLLRCRLVETPKPQSPASEKGSRPRLGLVSYVPSDADLHGPGVDGPSDSRERLISCVPVAP